MMRLLIWIAVCSLLACGPRPTRTTSTLNKEKPVEKSEENSGVVSGEVTGLELKVQSIPTTPVDSNALKYIMAVTPIDIEIAKGKVQAEDEEGLEIDLVQKRYALLKGSAANDFNPDNLTSDVEKIIDRVCGSTFVWGDDEFEELPSGTPSLEVGQDQIFLAWRSRHSETELAELAEFLLANDAQLKCALDVSLDIDSDNDPVTFLFEPFISEEAKSKNSYYRGTSDIGKAQENLVMLLVRDEGRPDGDWESVKISSSVVDSDVSFKRDVAAILRTDLEFSLDQTAGTVPCELWQTDTIKAADNEATQSLVVDIDDSDLKLGDLSSVSPDGFEEDCSAIVPSENEGEFGVGCSLIAAMEASQKNCSLNIEAENKKDKRNTIVLTRDLDLYSAELKDLTTPVGAVSVFPESANNPMRNAGITTTNFSADQEAALERAFDLWLEVSNETYQTWFASQIINIEYDSNNGSGQICETAGAYAQFGANKFFWCIGGAMAPQFLTPEGSPSAIIYRALTAFHETLHTHNKFHDFDQPAYDSCTTTGGTSYSVMIPVEIFRCTEDYCFGLKQSAINMFESELNYSLANDNRRFNGACDVLAKELGVTFQ